jgi:hypothetical protein
LIFSHCSKWLLLLLLPLYLFVLLRLWPSPLHDLFHSLSPLCSLFLLLPPRQLLLLLPLGPKLLREHSKRLGGPVDRGPLLWHLHLPNQQVHRLLQSGPLFVRRPLGSGLPGDVQQRGRAVAGNSGTRCCGLLSRVLQLRLLGLRFLATVLALRTLHTW